MSIATIGIFVGLALSIGGLIWKASTLSSNVKTLLEWKEKCPITQMELDIRQLMTENKIFWKDMERHLTKELHSPGHPVRDDLTEKLADGIITLDELRELEPLLEHEANNGNDKNRYQAAVFHARVVSLIAVKELHSIKGECVDG